jgi:hypothetical protein
MLKCNNQRINYSSINNTDAVITYTCANSIIKNISDTLVSGFTEITLDTDLSVSNQIPITYDPINSDYDILFSENIQITNLSLNKTQRTYKHETTQRFNYKVGISDNLQITMNIVFYNLPDVQDTSSNTPYMHITIINSFKGICEEKRITSNLTKNENNEFNRIIQNVPVLFLNNFKSVNMILDFSFYKPTKINGEYYTVNAISCQIISNDVVLKSRISSIKSYNYNIVLTTYYKHGLNISPSTDEVYYYSPKVITWRAIPEFITPHNLSNTLEPVIILTDPNDKIIINSFYKISNVKKYALTTIDYLNLINSYYVSSLNKCNYSLEQCCFDEDVNMAMTAATGIQFTPLTLFSITPDKIKTNCLKKLKLLTLKLKKQNTNLITVMPQLQNVISSTTTNGLKYSSLGFLTINDAQITYTMTAQNNSYANSLTTQNDDNFVTMYLLPESTFDLDDCHNTIISMYLSGHDNSMFFTKSLKINSLQRLSNRADFLQFSAYYE